MFIYYSLSENCESILDYNDTRIGMRFISTFTHISSHKSQALLFKLLFLGAIEIEILFFSYFDERAAI